VPCFKILDQIHLRSLLIFRNRIQFGIRLWANLDIYVLKVLILLLI